MLSSRQPAAPAGTKEAPLGAVLTIQGKQYDVEKDFTWAELMLVEELGGVPLGRDDAFESMAVIAAFVFSIQKRDDDALTWEAFVKQPIDVKDETETEAKPRPTRAKAA
jgi:hypothetical protein